MDDSEFVKSGIAQAFDEFVSTAGNNPRKLALLAARAADAGRRELAYPLARRARALAPGDPEILGLSQKAYSADVPAWHFDMVLDEARNSAYEAAIKHAIKPGDRVLDIGTGSGLLAMMAARAGASHVYTCEMAPPLADLAEDIIAANGYADRITLLRKKSTEIDVERDMGGRVDLLTSEIMGRDLIGEGILPTIADASSRLLKPGGRMIPVSGQIVIALADSSRDEACLVQQVSGFDLALLNRYIKKPVLFDHDAKRLAYRSEPVTIYDFDFTRGGDWGPVRKTVELASEGGRVGGVMLWMRFQLNDHIEYDAKAGSATGSTWRSQYFPLTRPASPPAGTGFRIHAWRDDHEVYLWIEE